MKKIILLIIIIIVGFNANLSAQENKIIKRISEGNKDAKITIITYESLTCGHCADFHKNVYPDLKKEFIDTGLVKIEFRHFPLDMAALNASKIAQCKNDGKSDLLHFLFSSCTSIDIYICQNTCYSSASSSFNGLLPPPAYSSAFRAMASSPCVKQTFFLFFNYHTSPAQWHISTWRFGFRATIYVFLFFFSFPRMITIGYISSLQAINHHYRLITS